MATKTHKDENFPVASALIAKKLRPHVMAYYGFARTADDIADNPSLSASEKISMLDELEAVLRGKTPADAKTKCAEKLKESLEITGIDPSRATDLLTAFRMDAKGETYHTWVDLMNYCKYSAAPVGRYLLDLHKESTATYWPSDMLCSALQILNHLQDCQKDWLEMHRAYIPLIFMENQGINYDELAKSNMTEKLQPVITLMLQQTEGLLTEASTLPLITFNRGLRMEIVTIHTLARRLLYRLQKQDLLASHVDLRKTDWIMAFWTGIMRGICRKQLMIPQK
ncbi:MAG: squalene synthase HpnC [Alphaproteobacteria bacterium]|nr:squalene synthase HpnC [Alphaproteobacteria bacterium]